MRWPNNARIAVLPQLGLEAFAGDHIEPSPIGLPPKGVTHINGKAWVDYGGRVGPGVCWNFFAVTSCLQPR